MNYIGIDLGGTRIKIGLVEDNTLVALKILNAQSINGLHAHLPLIDEQILHLQRIAGITTLDGIAMAFPGLVNTHTKRVLSTNKKYDDGPSLDLESYYEKNGTHLFLLIMMPAWQLLESGSLVLD
jgi:glucokinase